VEKYNKIIRDHAELMVDKVGKKGDTLYVPNLDNSEYLEYGKKSLNPDWLVYTAKKWFTRYAWVMRRVFNGKVNERAKLTLYWRVYPEIVKIDKEYLLYFRVYIHPKG
jgi:hypothetical protein